MNKDLLNTPMECELKSEINKCIVEAMTINDEVLAQSDYVTKEVKQRVEADIIQQRANNKTHHLDGELSFKLPVVFDSKTWDITVVIDYVWFKDMKTVKAANISIPTHLEGTSVARITKNVHIISLNLTLPVVGNQIMGFFPMVIQHELNHIYQQIRMGKTYPDMLKYGQATSDMRFGTDGDTRTVATLIYRLHPTEQDSFVNGMYAEVREKWHENPTEAVDNIIKATETYNYLLWCRQTLSEIQKQPNRFADIIRGKGYENVRDFIRKMKALLKRYQNKFAHCVMRIKNSCYGITDGYMRVNFGSLTEGCHRGEPIFAIAFKLY